MVKTLFERAFICAVFYINSSLCTKQNRIRLESENHKLALHGSSIQEQLNEKSKSMDLLSKKCEALSREHELTQKDLQLSEQSRIKSEQQAHCLLDKLEDAEVTLKEAVLMSTTLQKVIVLHLCIA